MVLILGGTGRARRLAATLAEAGVDAVTSLAGRTEAPLRLAGRTRVGGFGGVEGLVSWLRRHRPRAVVDATHPDAARISANAVRACREAGVPLCRYETPSWAALEEAGDWTWVADHAGAAARAALADGAVLLTVGRQPLHHYRALAGRAVLARMVDEPGIEMPDGWRIILQRGPFELRDERALLSGPPRVGCLVSKDAGGSEPDAKLVAARELGVEVVMISRPVLPPADIVATRETDVLRWLGGLVAGGG